jgi:hypothetical protein
MGKDINSNESFFIPIVSSSKHLTSSENDILKEFYHLCVSVSENEIDCPKKSHLKKSVNSLLSKTLTKKADVQKVDYLPYCF